MRIAYYALHYGKEYLAHSIRSIQGAVDEIHVLYTAKPSFGHGTDAANPDTLEELKREAARFAAKPVIWHPGTWHHEGQHRDAIIDVARNRGASVVVAVDADELWDPATLKASLDSVEHAPRPGVGRYRARFVHFFRSFGYICRDACAPERVIDVRAFPGEIGHLGEAQDCPVYHFGYAQSEALMRYKWKIHGHQSDLRPGWIDRFVGWRPGDLDVHPTNDRGFWNPEPTDPATAEVLARLLGDHPYYGLEIIG